MGYSDEIKKLTGDAGARRLGEIADVLIARLNQCCPEGPDLRARGPTSDPAPPEGEPNRPTSQ